MDATTKKLCEMLRDGDAELKACAARVFGELQPSDAPVLAALGDVAATGAGPAALFAVRALGASPEPAAVAHLVPALAGPPELRKEAEEAIGRLGRGALPYLKAAFADAPMPVRKAIASALVRLGGKPALELLFRGLADGDLDLSKHICFELDQAIQKTGDADRAALVEMVHSYLAEKRTQGNETALASGIILLGFLKSPKSKAELLSFVRPRRPPEVRRRALLALRGIAQALTAGEVAALAACLEEEDFPSVVLPTMDLLRPLPLPAACADRLVRLAGSPHQGVRDFAVYKMGRLDTPEAAKALIEQLDAPQPSVRELAVSSLQDNPAAAPLLLKRVKTEGDANRLWTVVRVLERHASEVPAAQAAALLRLMLECLEAGDRRAEPLSYLLRRVAPEQLDAALLKRATALKEKGRLPEADRLLTTLVRGGAASPEALYQAATVALKLSPKGISRSERHADPCLERFDRLVGQPDFGLATRLCSDRSVTPQELFYVGFHFAEQLGERRAFGGALLQHVVAAAPRAAVGASARNKLRLEAFPPPAPAPAKSTSRKPRR